MGNNLAKHSFEKSNNTKEILPEKQFFQEKEPETEIKTQLDSPFYFFFNLKWDYMKIYNILTEETIEIYYPDNEEEETKTNFNDYSKKFYYSPEFERIFVYGSVIASVYE